MNNITRYLIETLVTTHLTRKDTESSFFSVNEQLAKAASLPIIVKLQAVQTELMKRLVILDKELVLSLKFYFI